MGFLTKIGLLKRKEPEKQSDPAQIVEVSSGMRNISREYQLKGSIDGGETTSLRTKLKRERIQLEHQIEMNRLILTNKKILAQMQEIDGENSNDSLDGMLQSLILRAIQGHNAQQNPQNPQNSYLYGNPQEAIYDDVDNAVVSNLATAQTQQIQKAHITDEQLEGIWRTIPTEQKPLIKLQSDSIIRGWISVNYPQIDDDSVERALRFVREQS
jgi:hypothetical protein